LNTNEEDWNFYTLTFVIEVSTANGAFIRMVAMPTVELIDEPTEIITTVHLCPPPPQKIALTQRYLDFKNLYTKINN
jgi:hypothetical protein